MFVLPGEIVAGTVPDPTHVPDALSVSQMEPRTIINDESLIEKHVDFWSNNMPDISDKPLIEPEQLQFWLKQKRRDRKKPHTILKGVCGKWLNMAIDFAISKNKWGVQFVNDAGDKVDLVPELMVTVWLRYSSLMAGKPLLHSNACQVILKYFMVHDKHFLKAYHNRVYFYSSGSHFSAACSELDNWFNKNNGVWVNDRKQLRNADTTLRKVCIHTCLSTCIFDIPTNMFVYVLF